MARPIPAFPPGLRETFLPRVSLAKLLDHDNTEEESLFTACKTQGFFLLDLSNCQRGASLLGAADKLHVLAHESFDTIPDEEKHAIGFDKTKCLFGWKWSGMTDEDDTYQRKDVGEFFNMAKDDILRNEGCRGIQYPSPIKEQMGPEGTFNTFAKDCHATALLVIECLEKKLGLPEGILTSRHKIEKLSGDHVRLTWAPGDPEATDTSGLDAETTRLTISQHTDFGSVTILFNWLGGLQIKNHDDGNWEWVRPVPGHAIINLGDTMEAFSGKQLRSGRHRVVAAPGAQARHERYSIVYFTRPDDEVVMEDLTGSKLDPEAQSVAVQKRWKAGYWSHFRATQMGSRIVERAPATAEVR